MDVKPDELKREFHYHGFCTRKGPTEAKNGFPAGYAINVEGMGYSAYIRLAEPAQAAMFNVGDVVRVVAPVKTFGKDGMGPGEATIVEVNGQRLSDNKHAGRPVATAGK